MPVTAPVCGFIQRSAPCQTFHPLVRDSNAPSDFRDHCRPRVYINAPQVTDT